ncbi:MAG TPA: DNA repair exonuclease [Gemmatimonadaceae bacterium]|jgi:DNA repair exonuclease SbcCD nuclease subunit|nr:DNA repair exonuclease [Gemmatimonadaceae bacterium]
MRLVHLADIHLGFRQYQRQTPAGINQREADIATSLRRAIDAVIELRPDVVLIAGDVFHTVRPTNPAILHGFIQFSRLMQMLPDATVVMIAGNHDTPRTAETGCILGLFRGLGITVVDGVSKRISVPERDLMILAVPDMAQDNPALEPDQTARYNVLLLHGEIEGVLPKYGRELDRSTMEISKERLGAEKWDYVALGHYHVYRPVAANAFYSGSVDYTSTNPWGELAEEREAGIGGKGIIEHDLVTKKHKFHVLPPLRAWVDLAPLSGAGLSPAALDEAIRAALDNCDGGIDEKIVRLVVRDVPRHILRDLDHKSLREYKRRALHFNLDTRRPEIVRPEKGQASPGRRASLADTVRDKLRTRVLTENINREALVELGLHYLREADALAEPAEEEAIA